MQVPIFKAKDVDSNEIVEGFYFSYPEITSIGDADSNGVCFSNCRHCLLTYKPMQVEGRTVMTSMFGQDNGTILNEPIGCNIDIRTLELVRFEEVPCNNEETN